MCQCHNNPNDPNFSKCCGEEYCDLCQNYKSECDCVGFLMPLPPGQKPSLGHTVVRTLTLIGFYGVVIGLVGAIIAIIIGIYLLIALGAILLTSAIIVWLGLKGTFILGGVVLFLLSCYVAYRYIRRMPIM